MKHGMPFRIAFGLSEAEMNKLHLDSAHRQAFLIILGELEGGTFDWGAMAWKKPQ